MAFRFRRSVGLASPPVSGPPPLGARATVTCIVSAAALVLAIAPAHARNGTEWLSFCTSTPKSDVAAARYNSDCYSYPRGLADGITLWKVLDPDHGWICIPSAATAAQLRDVTIDFIRSNPKDRHLDVGILMGLAFQNAWPCSGKFKPAGRD